VLPRQPSVAAFMIDFEAALWREVAAEFPDASIKGCTFHFSQAIWRKTQELGLQKAYMEKRLLHKFIRYTGYLYLYYISGHGCTYKVVINA